MTYKKKYILYLSISCLLNYKESNFIVIKNTSIFFYKEMRLKCFWFENIVLFYKWYNYAGNNYEKANKI